MKCRRILWAAAVSLLLAGSCAACERQETPYISFTSLGEELGPYELMDTVYEYDLKTKQITEKFSYPCRSFSTAVYDREANAVYYVDLEHQDAEPAQNGKYYGFDEIYVHNLETGTDERLTHDLLAVRDIISDGNDVFFTAARQDDPDRIVLGKIDRNAGAVQYWDAPFERASVDKISVDRTAKRVYVSVFDAQERYNAMRTDGPTVTHTIYSFNYALKDRQEVLRAEGASFYSLCAMNGELSYVKSSHGKLGADPSPTITRAGRMNVSTGEVVHVEEESVGELAPDQKGVYQALQQSDGNIGIFYYDFAAKALTEAVDSSYNAANMVLFY